MRSLKTAVAAAFSVLLGFAPAHAQELAVAPEGDQKEYSPYLERGYPQMVFWGDTHVHTSYSTDAGMIGNRLGPDEAYRFARGEIVVSSTGIRARLQRALDFLVVADHAENLGLAPLIAESSPDLLKTEFGREIHGLVHGGDLWAAYTLWGEGMLAGNDPLKGNDALTRSVWERLTSSAERFNEPRVFTTLIGFEWTSSPDGNNLHQQPGGLQRDPGQAQVRRCGVGVPRKAPGVFLGLTLATTKKGGRSFGRPCLP